MKIFKVRITFRRILAKKFKYFVSNLLNWDMLILLLYKRCVIGMEKENLFKWKHYHIPINLRNWLFPKTKKWA